MTSPSFAASLRRYSGSEPGPRAEYASSAHLTARFTAPGDDHARRFRVPTPAHVARWLLAPPIKAAGATSPEETRNAARRGLGEVTRRYSGPPRLHAPRLGYEGLGSDPGDRPLTDYYAGLYAALNFAQDEAHPDSTGATFDRTSYVAAIVDATVNEVHAPAKPPRRPQAKRPARVPPQITPEARARYRATEAAKRRATTAQTHDNLSNIVSAALADLVADGELPANAHISRSDLLDLVRGTLSADERRVVNVNQRAAMTQLLAAAPAHGLREHRAHASRGFIYTAASDHHATEPEHLVTISEQVEQFDALTASADRAADALARVRIERELLAAQETAHAAGERVGALTLQRQRLGGTGGAVSYLADHRARRTA